MPKPFEKGDPRINRSGRKAGTPNRSTEELRNMLMDFIDANIETLQRDFNTLEPKDRLNFIDRMLRHVLPAPITSLEQLSEADLDILLEKLKSQTNEQNTENTGT